MFFFTKIPVNAQREQTIDGIVIVNIFNYAEKIIDISNLPNTFVVQLPEL